jgi:hypothetical protein
MKGYCKFYIHERPEDCRCEVMDCRCPYKEDKTWEDCDDYEERE